MDDKEKPKPEEESITAGSSSGGYQKFPLKPKFMDYAKEAFQPTEVRAQIDAIRKRRLGSS